MLAPLGAGKDETINDDPSDAESLATSEREAEELEDGSLDPDELTGDPAWWDEGSDDET